MDESRQIRITEWNDEQQREDWLDMHFFGHDLDWH